MNQALTQEVPQLRLPSGSRTLSVAIPSEDYEGAVHWHLQDTSGKESEAGELPADAVRTLRAALEAMERRRAEQVMERDMAISELTLRLFRLERQAR